MKTVATVVRVLLFCLACSGANVTAQHSTLPLRGYLTAHDPSTIVQCKNRYYVFHTGQGIQSKSSPDLIFWTPGPPVFSHAPAWTTNAVPGFAGIFWAPDVLYFDNLYHLWYAVSTFGGQVSAIGLVTNPTLDPKDAAYKWTDRGPVIQSTNGSPYNTIDPSFTLDESNHLWMAFGSYWNGIYIVQLDSTTGLRLAPNSPVTRLAYNSSIEASYIYRHDGFYYLFANWGSCCSGVNSSYNIRMGRSASVTGPYLDKDGVDMAANGGSLFQEGTGKFTGPGHVGIFSSNGAEWLSYHYYDANAWAPPYDAYGAPELAVAPLSWTEDDWPAFTNNWSAIYRFQTDARDDNGQYYGLLENGAAIQTDSVYGRVLNLNGANQDVWLPPGVGYAQTFAAVVKWRGGAAWQRIFDFGYDTTRTVMLTASSGDNVLRCDINPGGNLQTVQWTRPLPSNVWTHVAVTFNGSQGVLYVNGAVVATNTSMSLLPVNVAPQTNSLGRSKFVADPYFNGEYASFRAYGRALSPQEIVAPIAEISEPVDGSTYAPGGVLKFAGNATDFAAVPLPPSQMTWQINETQNGMTNVVFGPISGGASGSFPIPASASGNYTISLAVIDGEGRRANRSVTIAPSTAAVSNWASFYPFTRGAQDASNLNNGELQGGASIRSNALALSGNGEYVVLPPETGTAETVAGWIKWEGGNAWQRIFDFGQSDQDYFFLTPLDSSGHMQCAITTDNLVYDQVIESGSPFPLNQWTHVAVVMNGREGILYLNGNAVAVNDSVNLLPSDIGATRCYLGKSQYAADPYFAGMMSDFSLNAAPLGPTARDLEPAITVTPVSMGINLSWPPWAENTALYTTTKLAGSGWVPVGGATGSSSNAFSSTAPTTNLMEFYRLQAK